MTKSLTELANYHGTDKGTSGPSKSWGTHNYTDIYEPYLEGYRQSSINLLEIGLGVKGEHWDSRIVHGRNKGGASLRMWFDYFPKAKIYGIDVNECSYLNNDRIITFVGDQGNVEDLDAFVNKFDGVDFDVIIDDGSHRPDHQQVSFSCLFKKLKSGGLYFIEDLLSNGLGDGKSGSMASNCVLNTRSIMKYFREKRIFLEPNVITDQNYIVENIDYIRFHSPRVGIKYVLQPNIHRPLKKVMYHKDNEESLCVIRKK